MNNDDSAVPTVVAVLLADGWHQIVPGSFSAGPLRLAVTGDPRVPGFRFEEADVGRPYRPATLIGPLDSIIAIRQVGPAGRSAAESDRARPARDGQRADQGAQLRVMRADGRQAQRQAL